VPDGKIATAHSGDCAVTDGNAATRASVTMKPRRFTALP
jgi:hypothetical protein